MNESRVPSNHSARQLALAVGENAVFDGWTQEAVDAAAAQLGIDRAQARLAMPKGPAGLIDLYIQAVDREPRRSAGAARQDEDPREDPRAGVAADRDHGPAREAVRRALAILAMPQNVPLGPRIGWRSADAMWRIAGDTSTDFNHYTKRMILGGVYASTLLAWLDEKARASPTPPRFSTGGSRRHAH